LILPPEDTTTRTSNLHQSNTNGYKFQGTEQQKLEAQEFVRSWGPDGATYSPTPAYQLKLRELIAKYPYRLDTNFAKMDRIVHAEIEAFKTRVDGTRFHNRTILQWKRLLASGDEQRIARELAAQFDIHDDGPAVTED
jgi:23S rRNA G2069 N7-methylase RlmK/C1962 C5-methylase RlmI